MARMMRCLAVMEMVRRDGTGEKLQAGMEVDFDRVFDPANGCTVAQAVEGREECFEPVAQPANVARLPNVPTVEGK